MLGRLTAAAGAALLALEPETAHEAALRALEVGIHPRRTGDLRLAVAALGLRFPGPIGMAAGFDKGARVIRPLAALGFGFVEIGTVTPRAQPGNPRPRVFRLPEAGALINRLGFNSEGHAAVAARLAARRGAGIVGVNLGANKDSADTAGDYVAGLAPFWKLADYFTINVSSPNTPGLRDLQGAAALAALLARVNAERVRLGGGRPILVKLSPDMHEADFDAALEVVAEVADGVILTNTTVARDGVTGAAAQQTGGLSGAPLNERATALTARAFRRTGGRMLIVGVGGIGRGVDAVAKIEAGASLLQLYTGLIYRGPALLDEIDAALLARLHSTGVASIADLTGRAVS